MSHTGGGAGIGDDGQPNLVPLLDLVMQLVMFFMMCANFVMEQVDQTIMLPVAQSAKPMTETGSNVLFLNINKDGELLVVGRPQPLTADEEVIVYLQSVYDDAKRRRTEEIRKAGGDISNVQPETLVIVRAHKEANYSAVYRVMRKCQDVGLRRLQLRANIGGR